MKNFLVLFLSETNHCSITWNTSRSNYLHNVFYPYENPAFILWYFCFKGFLYPTKKKEILFNYSVVTVELNQPSPSWEHDERLGETEIVVQDPISLLAVSGELTERWREEERGQGRLKKKRKAKSTAWKKYCLR
jgi:hypothetical protein